MSEAASFSLDQAQRAAEEWGANCGPGALAAVLNLSLDAVRPHLQDFDRKRYTNPLMMYGALKSLGVQWKKGNGNWPRLGLNRVQWEGPWTAPNVPIKARYRHTHWVGSRHVNGVEIFDINAICVGGWIPLDEWTDRLVPWLLKQVEPKASGAWHITHRLEIAQ